MVGFLSSRSWKCPAPPPAWASAYGTNANGEYKLNLPKNSPIVAGVDAQIDACYMHYVWQTAPLELMQNQRFLLKYAALGAPGAVVASGFGVLANKENPNISIQTEMGTRNIHGYKTLTEDDLKTLEPGSVLQLWPNERIYALLLLYFNSEGSFDSAQCVKEAQKTDNDNDLAKLYSMSPNFLPKEQTSKGIKYPAIVGHSMIYMGLVNGRPIAADQHGRTLFLKDDPHQKWLTYLKFWIAAQWYDTDREI